MATSLHDTGEAYLPADEKRFIRGVTYSRPLRGGGSRAGSLFVGGIVIAVAVAGLSFAAAAI